MQTDVFVADSIPQSVSTVMHVKVLKISSFFFFFFFLRGHVLYFIQRACSFLILTFNFYTNVLHVRADDLEMFGFPFFATFADS